MASVHSIGRRTTTTPPVSTVCSPGPAPSPRAGNTDATLTSKNVLGGYSDELLLCLGILRTGRKKKRLFLYLPGVIGEEIVSADRECRSLCTISAQQDTRILRSYSIKSISLPGCRREGARSDQRRTGVIPELVLSLSRATRLRLQYTIRA